MIGPGAEYLRSWAQDIPEDDELQEGQRWSWTVSFTDPANEGKSLSHTKVLEGLTGIAYGEQAGSEGWQYMAIRQWFTEPPDTRQTLKMSTTHQSLICQQAHYGRAVFPPPDEESVSGKKLDFFREQRPDTHLTAAEPEEE